MADGTDKTQDSPEKVTSEDKQDTSQETLTKLQAQVEEAAQKRASDILAQKGREKDRQYESSLASQKKQIDDLQNKLDELEAGKDEGDSVKQRLEDKKAIRQLQAKIDELAQKAKDTELERDAERTKRQELEAEEEIMKAASGLAVSLEDLKAELKELGITEPSKFRRVAEMMAKKGEEPGRPDSGKGGGVSMNVAQIRKLYADGQISSKEYEDRMKAKGASP